MRLVTREEMIAIDRTSIDERGVPAWELMVEAGRAVAREALRLEAGEAIAVVCGTGNNGGDGFVAAAELRARGFSPKVFLLGKGSQLRDEAKRAFEVWKKGGGETVEVEPSEEGLKVVSRTLREITLIIDGIFGTGLERRKVNGDKPPFAFQVISLVNDCRDAGGKVLAIDLPSGMDADTGTPVLPYKRHMVHANCTVTMGLPKVGLVSAPGSAATGRLVIADLPFPKDLLEIAAPAHVLIEPATFRAAYPSRSTGTHKGDYGHVFIVGGSQRMPGALQLAVAAALRSGAGKVTAFVPGKELVSGLTSRHPEAMWVPLRANDDGEFHPSAAKEIVEFLRDHEGEKRSVILGPGAGKGEGVGAILTALAKEHAATKAKFSLVLDADALNLWAKEHAEEGFGLKDGEEIPVVLTPHPGELARLLGWKTKEVQADRLSAVRKAAKNLEAWVILKGDRTLVASPRGKTIDVNPTGNPGMAKGGMGDALAGIVGTMLITQRGPYRDEPSPRAALQAGVYIHGLAGDLAAAKKGEESLLPRDLIHYLPSFSKGLFFVSAKGREELRFTDEAALAVYAGKLAHEMKGGELIGLSGPLGSGKTTFVRAFVAALVATDKPEVHSPTFSLVHEYPTEPPVIHLDLYRLKGDAPHAIAAELEALGFRDYLDGRQIVLIEWYDRLAPGELPADLTLKFAFGSREGERQLTLSYVSPLRTESKS